MLVAGICRRGRRRAYQRAGDESAAGRVARPASPAGGDQMRRMRARALRLVKPCSPVRRPQGAAVAQSLRLALVRIRQLQQPHRRTWQPVQEVAEAEARPARWRTQALRCKLHGKLSCMRVTGVHAELTAVQRGALSLQRYRSIVRACESVAIVLEHRRVALYVSYPPSEDDSDSTLSPEARLAPLFCLWRNGRLLTVSSCAPAS